MSFRVGVLLAILSVLSLSALAAPQVGEVVMKLDPTQQAVRNSPLPDGGTWVNEGPDGQPALKVSIPPERAKNDNIMRIPLDLANIAGTELTLTYQLKSQDVTKGPENSKGIKCMVHVVSPSQGESWFYAGGLYGTFDWRIVSFTVPVPSDATSARLFIGMDSSSGTAWFSDLKLAVARVKPQRPEPLKNPPPVYKGHNLPALRGVQSPNAFSEKDFADLEKWNVNLIRWQMTRDWGKPDTDRDLAEYDRWLAGKLDDLEKALDSAQRHGIKIIIDIHSPPGGRKTDRTMAIFLEKEYQDHFINIWENIARRFKDHPAVWAYDLINEPVQNQPSPPGVGNWMEFQVRAAKAIRKIDPTTAICFETERWCSPTAYEYMVPVEIPNVIYQIHMYYPGDYTHQGVFNDWGEQGSLALIHYPLVHSDGTVIDKEALRRHLSEVRKFQLAYNAHIYVGEFSVIRWAPDGAKYLQDCVDLFEEYGWDWTYHAFREWQGWSVEHEDLPPSKSKGVLATQPTARAQVLLKAFSLNQRAAGK